MLPPAFPESGEKNPGGVLIAESGVEEADGILTPKSGRETEDVLTSSSLEPAVKETCCTLVEFS